METSGLVRLLRLTPALILKRTLPLSELQSTLRHQDISLTGLYATTDRVDTIEMDV